MPEFVAPNPNEEESERLIAISEIIDETDSDDPRAEEHLLNVDVTELERRLKIARKLLGSSED